MSRWVDVKQVHRARVAGEEKGRTEERTAVVQWIRDSAESLDGARPDISSMLSDLADAIDGGEHRK